MGVLVRLCGMRQRDCWDCAETVRFTPFLSFFFFSLAERGACAGERHGTRTSRLFFWRTHDYSTCHPWVRLFEAAMGQQEQEQLSLLLVGFFVTRVVCRSPLELLLETKISQNECSLEE